MKSKRNRRIVVTIITVLLLAVAGVFGYKAYNEISILIGAAPKDESKTIDGYSYVLRDNATEYQEVLFQELKEICNEDDKDPVLFAECVSKNFVADFFTFDNKNGKFDVGGMTCVNDFIRLNFYQKARAEFYHNLNVYINKYGKGNLLEVTSVTSEFVSKSSISVNSMDYDSYLIRNVWTYKEGNILCEKMQTTNMILLIENEGQMEVVNIYE